MTLYLTVYMTQLYSCVDMIPDFNADGNLPLGLHSCTWEEFVGRFGQTAHRQQLLAGLRMVLDHLKTQACKRVFINGSFITTKETPKDYDMCWDVTGVIRNGFDPILLQLAPPRLAMKIKYKGDIFPAHLSEGASGRRFLEFFQTDRATGNAKGIIVLEL